MFKVYDFEVFPNDWMCVIQNTANQEIIRIHNDKAALLSSLSKNDILVGFNNYNYDDIILWAIQTNQNPYEISKQIIDGQFRKKVSCGFLTLDVKQEVINKSLSLKESMANLGMNIIECPIDFHQEELTAEEIEKVFQYCENDVFGTGVIFKEREDYFTTKFEIVDTYQLKITDVKKTRANLASSVLQAVKKDIPRDRLNIIFDKNLQINELSKQLIDFYKNISREYSAGANAKMLEELKFDLKLANLNHTFGFGGVHAAKENYLGEGNFLHIDAKSYFPSIKINNNFISRRATKPERYEQMYEERLRLVEEKDSKAETHKILLNATVGAEKSEFNTLYDPVQFHNTTVNGQLIITHLILLLDPFIELIQTNTDGLIVKYEEKQSLSYIQEIIRLFSEQYNLKFAIAEINKIAQKDANNYCVRYTDGTIKAVGCMKWFEGGNWERNSLSIVDTALVNYYMHGIDIQKTVINQFKKDLSAFQLIAKKGAFDGMVQEQFLNGQMEMVPIQNVNRVFATKDYKCGSVFKVKNDKYQKVSECPEQAYIWNGPIEQMDRRKIDLNWYVKMVQKQLFV